MSSFKFFGYSTAVDLKRGQVTTTLVIIGIMKIRQIQNSDWESIVAIQNEAYFQIRPESEGVLRSKAEPSPNTCLVCLDVTNSIIGYCLSHPFPYGQVPSLNTITANSMNPQNLFLHDLAVSTSARGIGVAKSLFDSLNQLANELKYKSISLVSVQNSCQFWSKMGFEISNQVKVSQSYGESSFYMECLIL